MALWNDVLVVGESRWFTYWEDLKFKLFSMHSPEYRRRFRDISRSMTDADGDDKSTEQIEHEMNARVASCMVDDWSGMADHETDDAGNAVFDKDGHPVHIPVAYSADECFKRLTDHDAAPAVLWIINQAHGGDGFRPESAGAISGNSPDTSGI